MAFDEIVRRFQHPLQRYAARMLNSDQATAAEIAIETLTRLWERRQEYRHCDRLASWLYRTAHRLVLDELASNQKMQQLTSLVADNVDVGRVVEIASMAEAAKIAVSQLSVPLRSVFILSVYHEMTYQEIASTLDITMGTVASRKHEAIANLKQRLHDWKETL